jgi:hypothetical protein
MIQLFHIGQVFVVAVVYVFPYVLSVAIFGFTEYIRLYMLISCLTMHI